MPLKLNISEKGKAWKLEVPEETLSGKSIGDKIDGKEIKPELEGYELEITGGSDSSGFPLSKDAEGLGLKSVLLSKGWGMKSNIEGLRLRKTVRGKVVSETTSQINLNVLKAGKKPLAEIFPEQAKPKEKPKKEEKKAEAAEIKPAETKPEEKKKEPVSEKKKEEKPAEQKAEASKAEQKKPAENKEESYKKGSK